jgi:predicted lipoprotein with Yx(FWY)xxD motif
MRTIVISSILLSAAIGLVACGGGSSGSGSGGSGSIYGGPVATPMATPVPTATPTGAASPAGATTLAEATLLGAPGFVAPTTSHTVYQLSGDTPTTLECTVASSCTSVWPPVTPPAGVALSTGFATFVRSDNGATQLEYLGHPLYTFAPDTAAGQTNGNGIVSFGGTWSVARP